MDGSRDYDLCIRQQPKQARMCGVGGMSFNKLYSFFLFFAIFFFALCFFVAMEWGRSHSLARSQPIDGQSTLRPSCNCASSTRLVKTSRRPHPRRRPPSTINSPPRTHMRPTTRPRVVRSLGHVHAHPGRLWRRTIPAEPVLLYVRQSRQARRRHRVALDEGASFLFFTGSFFLPSSASRPLFTSQHSPGWQDQMYHGIGCLVALSPERFRERQQRRWLLRLSGSQRAPRGVLSSQAQPFRSSGVRSHISFRLLPLFTFPSLLRRL
jgi:hypothetical protein